MLEDQKQQNIGGYLIPEVVNNAGHSDQMVETIQKKLQKLHSRFIEDLLEIANDFGGGYEKMQVDGTLNVDWDFGSITLMKVTLL